MSYILFAGHPHYSWISRVFKYFFGVCNLNYKFPCTHVCNLHFSSLQLEQIVCFIQKKMSSYCHKAILFKSNIEFIQLDFENREGMCVCMWVCVCVCVCVSAAFAQSKPCLCLSIIHGFAKASSLWPPTVQSMQILHTTLQQHADIQGRMWAMQLHCRHSRMALPTPEWCHQDQADQLATETG